MHVLSAVFVVVCVGQVCQGASLPQGPTSLLRHAFPAPAPPEPGDSATHPHFKTNDYIALEKYLRTVIKEKEMKYQTPSETGTQVGTDRPDEGRARVPVPVSLTGTKSSAIPRRLGDPSVGVAEHKAGSRLYPSRHVKPWTSHSSPEVLPARMPCKDPRKYVPNIATAPPGVCDLCPDEDGKNPLDPCTCVGVGGTSTGQISINCPSTIYSLDQIRDIFHNTDFLVTHVFQFTLQGSRADGALTRDIWGDLDFKYVSINDNKITDVDNGAFIGSTETLISLNLANNEIKSFIALYNDLPNLLSLNLRGNNISLIFSEDYKYPSLTDLDLSSNQISSIGTKSFAALKKLTSLNLSYNQLASIGDDRFIFIDHDYFNALVIDLSHNKIAAISDAAFLGLRNVEINFRFNQLDTLKENVFYPIILDSQYYAYFHFSDNPMVCDCRILWVLRDGKALACFDNFLCTNNNKHLYSLTIADLGNCSLSSGVGNP
ncbi:uncharacterized protein LOC135107584 [Scylla paramamosain]|uniref:uncharacterized protein LOC135107584 n=1 Tax=Scylla paramamosain TaxID=85552 RepID=UPI0030827997